VTYAHLKQFPESCTFTHSSGLKKTRGMSFCFSANVDGSTAPQTYFMTRTFTAGRVSPAMTRFTNTPNRHAWQTRDSSLPVFFSNFVGTFTFDVHDLHTNSPHNRQ
jgi:hypothetical protein